MRATIHERFRPEDFGGAAVQPMVDLDGYELIVGSSLDPQFGPVLLFGSAARSSRSTRTGRWRCRR
jgi:acetyltransferase